jgi:hypothetical protein
VPERLITSRIPCSGEPPKRRRRRLADLCRCGFRVGATELLAVACISVDYKLIDD